MALKSFLLLVAVSYVSAITFPEESTNRLTNSPAATINQFPFAISLQRLADLPNHVQAHQCGGALITLQHALTTALCVHTNVNNVPQLLPANAYRVYAGAALLSNDAADRSRNVANFTVHPDYIPYPASVNDIAIITTTLPFPNTTMTPIQLPAANFVPADNVLCNVAGWGAPTTTVQASNELRFSTKYIYNNSLCANVWSLNPATTNILPSMICAASYNVISSGCTGDAGNPLVCNNQLTGLLFLTNQCAVSSYPEVYTRVSNYIPWIRSITGAGSTFKPEFSFLAVVAVICMKVFS